MSLRDRLKSKKTLNNKKEAVSAQTNKSEKSAGKSNSLLNVQEKISSLLHKKILSTPKWRDYSDKKQEGFVSDFILEQLNLNFPSLKLNNETISKLINEIFINTKEFGIIEDLLQDDEISYVMINGAENVYAEKNNELLKANISFKNQNELRRLIISIVSGTGRALNEKNPVLDFYHRRGYRINIMIPPAVSKEPCITIKKINSKLRNLENLLKLKSISLEMLKLFETAVLSGTNILISGLEESGKTTFLNGLCNKIPQSERAILIEDVDEMKIDQKNIIRLNTQPINNSKDAYQVTALNLIKNASRMRLDRIVLGECKGEEAYEFLKAMKTGYLGLMTTLYADSAIDSLNRFENMILNSSRFSANTIKNYLADLIGLVIYIQKMPNGKRKVVSVSEPIVNEDGAIELRDIFVWKKQVEDNKILYEHVSTGIVPKFLTMAREKGFELNNIIFDTKYAHTYPEK